MKLNEKYELNLPDYRIKQWEYLWEKERLDALRSRISEGTVVYDIGAEEGDISALMATWGARVVCVEPSPFYWPRIKRCFDMNNVTIAGYYVGFASDVTDEKGKLNKRNRNLGEPWPRASFWVEREGFRHLAQETDITPQVTIDELVERLSLTPGILNIDCEGSELKVLQGAKESLSNHRPKVFVSIHPLILKEWYEAEEKDVHKFMEDIGYKKTILGVDHEIHAYYE
jgi:FkbM family methyltransferase